MKRILGLSIALAALLVFVGCEEEITLVTPDVTIQVLDNGATLRLTWDEVTDADGYYIYRDGVLVDSIDEATTTTYDADEPAQLYEVSAFAGEDESATDQIDCEPVVTTSLEVWDTDDSDTLHPSAFGFNTSGTAIAYAIGDTTSWPSIDYYIHGGATTEFWSPHHGNLNDQVNVTKNSGETDFDDIDICDAPGAYLSQTEVSENAVYYFWIDPTDNGWDAATDYFGKIKVEDVSGNKVTMRLAFQTIAGLRWCVTD
jgi:hypothetical protein